MKLVRRWLAPLVVLVMVVGVGIPPFGNVCIANAEDTDGQTVMATTTPAKEEPKDKGQADSKAPKEQPVESVNCTATQTESPSVELSDNGDVDERGIVTNDPANNVEKSSNKGSYSLAKAKSVPVYSCEVRYDFEGVEPRVGEFGPKTGSGAVGADILKTCGIRSVSESVQYNGKSYVLGGIYNADGKITTDPRCNVVVIIYKPAPVYSCEVWYYLDGRLGEGEFGPKTGSGVEGAGILETCGIESVSKGVQYNGKSYVLERIINRDGTITTDPLRNVVAVNYTLDENKNNIPDNSKGKVTVTFQVVNGAWNDGSTGDKTISVNLGEDGTYTLTSDDVPRAGEKPATGYKAGSWNVNPVGQKISKNGIAKSEAVTIQSYIDPADQVESTRFVYTYAKDEGQQKKLSYKTEAKNDSADNDDRDKSAKTGDETPIGAIGAILLLSALGGIFALRKKEN